MSPTCAHLAAQHTPRSIKYTLLGYFGRGTYKLWDRASGTAIKSRDVIFEEGRGHRTISDAPTAVFDVAFDDDSVPAPSHDANTTPRTGVVVPPKPLAPRPRITDPPLHPESTTRIAPNAPSHDDPPTAQPPTAPRRSTHLAVLGTGAPMPNTAVFLTTLPDSQIPRNYWEAMTRPDLWRPAMETEWAVLKERGVFELVDAPPDAHVIDSMWVYANKYNADGDIIRCKARLVAKGYTQIPGLDYDQTYASVLKETPRDLLVYA